MKVVRSVWLCWLVAGVVRAEPLTLPEDQRPAWLERDGIVMAGSWEPLGFRVRRDGSDGYTPTPQQQADYLREHSPDMIAQLKGLGVNFVMMHCYKGAGRQAEAESMADAVRFAKLCHEAGLRVGVYNYSGAFLWELLFKEVPQARDWVILDAKGQPMTYGKAAYRYYWNRNHPDAQLFYRDIVRFAVNDIRADLIHFDNYVAGPGSEIPSVRRFRESLRQSVPSDRLAQMGIGDIESVEPPLRGPPDSPLRRAWHDFTCQSLADSYADMARYARTLRPDVLVECNPGGVGSGIAPPIDHGRLLQGGDAFWDEGGTPGWREGQLHSRIRTYKVARRMGNIAFCYSTTPLEMAEAMAFNRDCLGCICWFEYGTLVDRPASKEPVSPALRPFIRFFHARRDLLRGAAVIADAAVWRSFASQVFADPKHARLTSRVEQTLIESRIPFQIIYDQHLSDLNRYRVLVLAGCVAASDDQVRQISRYVASGGRLCIVGPAVTHDEWMLPRSKSALDDLPAANVVRITEDQSVVEAVTRAAGGDLSLSVTADPGLGAELTEQARRRLVHLVNYRPDAPVRNAAVRVRIPAGRTVERVILAGPGREADETLPFEHQDDRVSFTVPVVNVYEIAVVVLK